MYLYFNKERKLQTMIAHGSPVRQGDSFGLYVCLDLDFFDDEQNSEFINEDLYFYYKKSNSEHFEPYGSALTYKGVCTFQKNAYDEVTYKLVDEEKYLMYYAIIPASSRLTENSGDLNIVLSFDTITPSDPQSDTPSDDDIMNAATFAVKLYVEPTYGKNRVKMDSTVNTTNYQQLLGYIEDIRKKKNIALEKIENITYPVNATQEEKLEVRAASIYSTWNATKKGWIIIGEDESGETTLRDMYVLFDDTHMLVVSSETGIIYNFDGTNLSALTYTINIFGDLSSFLESQNKANLVALLQDYLSRITDLETVTLQDIVYSGGKIKYKQNNSYYDLVTNTQYREDLGINNIENNGTFGVEYTNTTLKAKNGLNNEKTDLFTANSLKADMNLDLVPNKSDSGVIQDSSNYFATVKAVFDTLEKGAAGAVDQNTNTTQFNEAMRRIRYMYQYFSESTEDIDNKINKLEEIIAILDGLPENSDIYATITNIFNKIGEGETDTYFYDPNPNLTEEQRQSRTIKGRIDYLYQNADKNIIVFIRYSEPGNQDLLTIPVANWIALSEPNENYPDAEYYAVINPRTIENPDNPAFDNVVDMEIIFDKESEQEYIVGAEFDQTARVLNIYANSLPNFAITIDTIKLISNIHHTMSLNVAESNLLANHTVRLNGHDTDISNLSRDKMNIRVLGEDGNYSSINHFSDEIEMKIHDEGSLDFIFNANNSNFNIGYYDGNNNSYQISYSNLGQLVLSGDSNTYDYAAFGDDEIELENRGLVYKSQLNMNNGSIQLKQIKGTGNQQDDTTVSLDIKDGKFELNAKKKNSGNTFTQSTMNFDETGSLKIDNNPVLLQKTNTTTDNNVEDFKIQESGITVKFRNTTTSGGETIHPGYTRQVAMLNDGDVVSGQVQGETYSRGKIDTLLSAKQTNDNLVTSFQTTPDDTHYPSEKLVKDSLDTKQNNAMITDFNSNVDNQHYPSAKLVNDTFFKKTGFYDFNVSGDESTLSQYIELNKTYKIDGGIKIELESYSDNGQTGTSIQSDVYHRYRIINNSIFKITEVAVNSSSGYVKCIISYIDSGAFTTSREIWVSENMQHTAEYSSNRMASFSFQIIGILTKLD